MRAFPATVLGNEASFLLRFLFLYVDRSLSISVAACRVRHASTVAARVAAVKASKPKNIAASEGTEREGVWKGISQLEGVEAGLRV